MTERREPKAVLKLIADARARKAAADRAEFNKVHFTSASLWKKIRLRKQK